MSATRHGGRKKARARPSITGLFPDRIQDGSQLKGNGGVRRGTDILKPLAPGANGCSIGAPYIYGFATGLGPDIVIYRAELGTRRGVDGPTRVAEGSPVDRDLQRLAHPRTFARP